MSDGHLIPSGGIPSGALSIPTAMRPVTLPAELVRPVAELRAQGMNATPSHGYPLALRQSAELAAEHYEAALAAPPPELARALSRPWLVKLGTAVRWKPSKDELDAFTEALLQACGDMPALVWCQETNTAAMLRFTAWPSVAELASLLRGHAASRRIDLRALRVIAKEPPPALPPPLPREEAIAALAEVRAAIQVTRPAPQPGNPALSRIHERAAVTPRPLSGDHLAALRAANPVLRAAMAKKGVQQ